MLKIWGRRNAFNVQKVMWLVAELGLAHEHIPAGGHFGGLNTPEFLTMNPCGHIPVIEDAGKIVWESHTILRYLAASYGGTKFWSEDPYQRSLTERWMDWAQTSLQPDFLTGVFWGYYRTPKPQQNWSNIHESNARCSQYFQLLNSELEERFFLCGNQLTLADISVGTALYRYFELDIERPAVPYVEAWYKRLQEREAYRQHVMIPFSEMKGRLDY